MERIVLIACILSNLFVASCKNTDTKGFLFDKWDSYIRGVGFNPFYDEYFFVSKDLREVKNYTIKIQQNEQTEGLTALIKFKDGFRQEELYYPFTADDYSKKYYYDDFSRLIKKEYFNWENVLLQEYSLEYGYEYNAKAKEFIQTVFNQGKIKEIITEKPVKSGYQLVSTDISNSSSTVVYEVYVKKRNIIQYRVIYGGVVGTSYYDFTYNDSKLKSIQRYNITDNKKTYVSLTEIISYDNGGNINEMVTYNYINNDAARVEPYRRHFFSDYDKNGNWQRQEVTYFNVQTAKQIYKREFSYAASSY